MEQRWIDYFEERIQKEPNSGCWLWEGPINTKGYGQTPIGPKPVGRGFNPPKVVAHRFSYELYVWPLPQGLQLDHLCRVRCCVNPQHLEPVTARTNSLRGFGPAGIHARQTHCKRGHLFSQDNIYRSKADKGRGWRACRQCGIEASRQRVASGANRFAKRRQATS